MKIESLQVGWVKFRRFHCKDGFIDCWVGDCANHPNNEKASGQNLNSFKQMYRLNEGEWTDSRVLPGMLNELNAGDEFTADEIWNEVQRIEAKRRN